MDDIGDVGEGIGELLGAAFGGVGSRNGRDGSGCAIFIIILIVATILVGIFAYNNKKEPKPEPPKVEKTETFSHKAGVKVRESGVEFFKGVIGMDSKLKKESETKDK